MKTLGSWIGLGRGYSSLKKLLLSSLFSTRSYLPKDWKFGHEYWDFWAIDKSNTVMEKLFVFTMGLSVEGSYFLGKWRRKCYTTKYWLGGGYQASSPHVVVTLALALVKRESDQWLLSHYSRAINKWPINSHNLVNVSQLHWARSWWQRSVWRFSICRLLFRWPLHVDLGSDKKLNEPHISLHSTSALFVHGDQRWGH